MITLLHPFPCRLFTLVLIALCLLVPAFATAQGVPVCPPATLLSLARAGSACFGLAAGEACYGAGLVTGGSLTQPGDRAALAGVSDVTLQASAGEPDSLPVASLAVQTEPGAESGVYLLAYGALRLVNEAAAPVEQTARSIGAAVLRALPEADADALAQLAVNDAVVADGRDDSGAWLRVRVPASGLVAWAAVESFTLENAAALPVVNAEDTAFRPFQAFTLIPAESPFTACDGKLTAGLLVQAPSTTEPSVLQINGLPVEVRGTVLLLPEPNDGSPQLRVVTLAGDIRLDAGAEVRFVPPGAEMVLLLNESLAADATLVTPYTETDWSAVPLNNLPARVTLAEPLDEAGIETALAADQASLTAQNTPPPTPTPDTSCRRTVWRDTSARSGPADFYDTVYDLPAGTALDVVLAARDPDGGLWWQPRQGGWVNPRDVTEEGECVAPPVAETVAPPPNNLLVMETCATNNGPLRAGQQVTITFTPPPWNSYAEAVQAVRTDPGRVRVNRVRLPAVAGEPIRLGTVTNPLESRYIRVFTATWTAEPGTFRIIGEWLHYEPLCTVTVPVNP